MAFFVAANLLSRDGEGSLRDIRSRADSAVNEAVDSMAAPMPAAHKTFGIQTDTVDSMPGMPLDSIASPGGRQPGHGRP